MICPQPDLALNLDVAPTNSPAGPIGSSVGAPPPHPFSKGNAASEWELGWWGGLEKRYAWNTPSPAFGIWWQVSPCGALVWEPHAGGASGLPPS